MLHYRKATLADIPDLVLLRAAMLKEVTNVSNPANDITEVLTGYFNTHLPQGDFVSWLALDGDTVVGSSGIIFHSYPPSFLVPMETRAYILNVYTLPAYRRMGIARALFEHLMQEGRDRSIVQVMLHASPVGAPLYAQFGFVPRDSEMVWRPILQ